ncbi:MAG: hypothetical protein ACYTHK_05830 [Planctomycetota bacterium]|jgi:hypothetical protein
MLDPMRAWTIVTFVVVSASAQKKGRKWVPKLTWTKGDRTEAAVTIDRRSHVMTEIFDTTTRPGEADVHEA